MSQIYWRVVDQKTLLPNTDSSSTTQTSSSSIESQDLFSSSIGKEFYTCNNIPVEDVVTNECRDKLLGQ